METMNTQNRYLIAIMVLAMLSGCSGQEFSDSNAALSYDAAVSYDAEGSFAARRGRMGAPRMGKGVAAIGLAEQSDQLAEDLAPDDFQTIETARLDRYLIRTANIVRETENAREAADVLTQIVVDAGGYMSELNESVDAFERRSVTLTARVPAVRFDSATGSIENLGKLIDKQVRAQDMTEEYVDTDSRNRNLKKAEERILDHLDRTGDLEDIINVERELARVRGEIETMDGRLRFLNNRVAYSTLHVTLREKPSMEPVVPAATFSIGNVFSQALRSLVGFGQSLAVVAVWVGVWAPVWAPLCLVAWVARRRWLKGRPA
jgi:hypothetical protein